MRPTGDELDFFLSSLENIHQYLLHTPEIEIATVVAQGVSVNGKRIFPQTDEREEQSNLFQLILSSLRSTD